MTIASDIKPFYPDDWEQIRERVLERAANRSRTESGHSMPGHGGACCEWCGRPNGVDIPLYNNGRWEWLFEASATGDICSELRDHEGKVIAEHMDYELYDYGPYTMTRTVLTVAHLDQDPRGDNIERLRALCQRCHLTYDAQPEQRAKRERIYAELRGQQSLFGGAA